MLTLSCVLLYCCVMWHGRTEKRGKKKSKAGVKSKDWVLEKKERRRQEGRATRDDSKYTARRRPGAF